MEDAKKGENIISISEEEVSNGKVAKERKKSKLSLFKKQPNDSKPTEEVTKKKSNKFPKSSDPIWTNPEIFMTHVRQTQVLIMCNNICKLPKLIKTNFALFSRRNFCSTMAISLNSMKWRLKTAIFYPSFEFGMEKGKLQKIVKMDLKKDL